MSWANNPAKLGPYERALRCVLAIHRGEPVSVPWMKDKLGLSSAQAKRDMNKLERLLPAKRVRIGGRAVLVLDGGAS